MNTNPKRAVVFGMARSGIAAAKLLSKHGYDVTINDKKTEEQFEGKLDELRKLPGVHFALGQPVDGLLASADLLVVSPGIPAASAPVQKALAMGVEVIGELELAYRLSKGDMVCITGTNGKTTTTTLTKEIFANAGRKAYAVGNIGDPYSDAALTAKDGDQIVCEVSSYQCETISTFHPHVAAILNITEDHLNRHGTMEVYYGLKERVFAHCDENDFVVLNYDDAITRGMAERVARARVAWFSRLHEVDFGAFVRDGEIVFGERDNPQPVCRADEVFIPGPHNLENALAATAVAMCAGVDAATVAHTLKTFRGVEHRIETVRVLDGVTWINDSKGTNVDSTIKAIQTMRTPTVLIAGGSDKHTDFTPMVEEMKRGPITAAVLIGDTAEQLRQTMEKQGFSPVVMAGYDFAHALDEARRLAVPGGNVLLSPACASFDMFTDFENRGEIFKQMVNAMEGTGA